MEVKSPLQTDILHLTEADIKDLAKMHGNPGSARFAPPCSPRYRQPQTGIQAISQQHGNLRGGETSRRLRDRSAFSSSRQYLNNMAISEEGKQAGACVTEVLFHHRDFEAVEFSSAAFC